MNYTRILTYNKNKLFLSDLEIKFTRRNYENTYQKAQTLDLLLKNNKIAPRQAYVVSGLFSDPESACDEGMAWYKEQSVTQPQPTPTPSEETSNEESKANCH